MRVEVADDLTVLVVALWLQAPVTTRDKSGHVFQLINRLRLFFRGLLLSFDLDPSSLLIGSDIASMQGPPPSEASTSGTNM